MLEMQESFQREGFHTIVIKNEVTVLSSTQLRRLLQEHQDISGYVNPDVLNYIKTHSLFGGNLANV